MTLFLAGCATIIGGSRIYGSSSKRLQRSTGCWQTVFSFTLGFESLRNGETLPYLQHTGYARTRASSRATGNRKYTGHTQGEVDHSVFGGTEVAHPGLVERCRGGAHSVGQAQGTAHSRQTGLAVIVAALRHSGGRGIGQHAVNQASVGLNRPPAGQVDPVPRGPVLPGWRNILCWDRRSHT